VRAGLKTLILGGVRSGKSRYADELARAAAHPVTVIATAQPEDEEMTRRIEAHRRYRSPDWTVIEEPVRLAAALRAAAAPASVIIIDCLTLWLSNLLCGEDPDALEREMASFLQVLPEIASHCLLVSNEVGFGIIPASPLARRFGDEAGALHQRLAPICDRVVLMVAGLPMSIKAAAS
jgi:adenosylcobinamide kinase/adenosylcobinamide-phosphate guanylyltransferase